MSVKPDDRSSNRASQSVALQIMHGYNTPFFELSNQYAMSSSRQLYPGSFWCYQILPYVDVQRSKTGSREGLQQQQRALVQAFHQSG